MAEEEKKGITAPRKAKDIPAQDVVPNLMWPMILPGLRTKLYKWYPGPTFCAHKMHYSEWLFAIFAVIATVVLVFAFVVGPIGVSLTGALLAVNATVALLFIWGFAKYKSLADLADRLEKIAQENHTEVCAYQGINDEWDEGLKRGQENLNAFTASLGLVTDDAEALNELTDALKSMVTQKKKIQAEEKALFEIQKKHQRMTRAEIDEKERTTMKRQLTRLFDRIARATGGDKKLSSAEGIDQLKKKLQESQFLNQTEPGTDEPMFAWLPEFQKMADDGEITKYELLDALDVASHSYFLEIKTARERTPVLEEEYEDMKNRPL